ncbi:flagellar hook-associated protein 3 [Pseudomonas sp. JDS28PS106]|uniref:flagellar hook-associated protein 3 n=1 Tax=Pseudomonas sp. JDS28PS106 TaxID=2497235 RepID=UPI002FD28B7D
MRISTTQFFEATTANYQRSYSNVMKTSEEISSGVKLNTAADNPIGAARVLQLSQQNSMLTQYASNITTINTNITNTETALRSISDSIQAARELIVKAGNGSYTDSDRISTANELKELQQTILGLMNSQDSNGQYMFGGSKSSTPPYSLNADGSYSYDGDQNAIKLAVGDGLSLAATTTGYEAFEQALNTTRTSSTRLSPATEDGKVTLSNGVVQNSTTYNSSYQGGEPYTLTFISATEFRITDGATPANDVTVEASNAGKIDYSSFADQTFTFRGVDLKLNLNLTDADKATSGSADTVLTGRSYQLASTPDTITVSRSPGNASAATVSGAAVGTSAADLTTFNNVFPSTGAVLRYSGTNGYELYASPYTANSSPVAAGVVTGSVVKAAGVEFTIAGGPPADGDVFQVQSGTHQTENILNTLTNVINVLNTKADGDLVATQKLNAALTSALGNVTSSSEQVSTAISAGGARQVAAKAQDSTNELLKNNNTLEQDSYVNADVVEATTRLTLQKTMLEASQAVFTQLSRLNLFSQL